MAQMAKRNSKPVFGDIEMIKPCPFCGHEAAVEEVDAATGRGDAVCFTVGCLNDEEESCMGYQSLTTFARRSDAIKAWNKRA